MTIVSRPLKKSGSDDVRATLDGGTFIRNAFVRGHNRSDRSLRPPSAPLRLLASPHVNERQGAESAQHQACRFGDKIVVDIELACGVGMERIELLRAGINAEGRCDAGHGNREVVTIENCTRGKTGREKNLAARVRDAVGIDHGARGSALDSRDHSACDSAAEEEYWRRAGGLEIRRCERELSGAEG